MFEFILGIIFINTILPILDGLTSLLLTWIESKKGQLSIQIAHSNKRTQQIAYQEDEDKHSIGFLIEEEESDE